MENVINDQATAEAPVQAVVTNPIDFNEEINSRITGYLDAIQSSVDSAGKFTVDQMPIVAQEYLSWTMYESVIWMFASAIFIAATIGCVRLFWWMSRDADSVGKPLVRGIATVVGMLFSFLFLSMFLSSVIEIVKVQIAPRIVLIEKLSDLIN